VIDRVPHLTHPELQEEHMSDPNESVQPEETAEPTTPAAEIPQTDLDSVAGGCWDNGEGGGYKLPEWIVPTFPPIS
jgi:hypothetical protein